MKLKLDARTVRAVSLAKGRDEDFAWDTELKGFALRLRRGSDGGLVRTWTVQYRINGRTRRMALGSFERVKPAQAREKAREYLAQRDLGNDPQAERQAKRQAATQTFRAVVKDYLAAREGELRPQSFSMAKLYLEKGPYFRPLHAMGITAIARSHVAGLVRTITKKHGAPTAVIARRHLSKFFAWCIADGLLGDGANPVDGSYPPADPESRDRVLSDAELVAVWRACRDDDYGRICRLLILTGCRRAEIGGMKWGELKDGVWTLPAERSKNHRSHAVALPPLALDIIAAVPRCADRDHLFGDRSPLGFVGWVEGKEALDRRLGTSVGAWRVHDLRRTTATKMADIGIEPHVIEAVLNHYSGHRAGPAGIYNRSPYTAQMRSALLRWSDHVLALVEGRASNIVAMRA